MVHQARRFKLGERGFHSSFDLDFKMVVFFAVTGLVDADHFPLLSLGCHRLCSKLLYVGRFFSVLCFCSKISWRARAASGAMFCEGTPCSEKANRVMRRHPMFCEGTPVFREGKPCSAKVGDLLRKSRDVGPKGPANPVPPLYFCLIVGFCKRIKIYVLCF